ncbi:hypothetical protein Emin_0587 [Elusimicrobium minutum Pei191]|uniref:Peptidase MA-like domain-containing protein n=1 Tax=Elusimicrobium minutum (strain Pei191) TaxID=445932 RepID=B2KC15_ELUMP|nr:hypothetical protein [Elusimicrobium minutum]ACC98142.1 hypothetical protein Emin_0587 [Elusimicrobium minutum Pei191]
MYKKMFCVFLFFAAVLLSFAQNNAQKEITKEQIDSALAITLGEQQYEDISSMVKPALPGYQAETAPKPRPQVSAPSPAAGYKPVTSSQRPKVTSVQPAKTEQTQADLNVYDQPHSAQSYKEDSTFSLINSNGNITKDVVSINTKPAPSKPLQTASATALKPKPAQPPAQPRKKDYSKPSPKDWSASASTNFNIFLNKTSFGMYTPNIAMTLEGAHSTLKMNLPQKMPPKTNVYIYKNQADYLKGEFKPFEWSEAVFLPSEATIVLYNTLGDRNELKRKFMHEFTHMINDAYFNPTGKGPLTPLWLDEGMAVNMEDISSNTAGGEWANDLLVLDIYPSAPAYGQSALRPASDPRLEAARSATGRKYFAPFGVFMLEDSLDVYTKAGRTQDWYLQAYAMVRFLWKPYNSATPENQIKFRQFLSLMAEGELARDNKTNMPIKDAQGKNIYRKYNTQEALYKAYGFRNSDDFEKAFWNWYNSLKKRGKSSSSYSSSLGQNGYNTQIKI